MGRRIVFLQRRGHRAGAQRSLLRLFRAWPAPGELTLLTGEKAWLAEAAADLGVEVHVRGFPSSRSLASRVAGGVRRFATSANLAADVYCANTHEEVPHALAMADLNPGRTAVVLRESLLNESSILRYRVLDCDRVLSVSAGLDDLVSNLDCRAQRYSEFLFDDEFSDVSVGDFPKTWLVGGHKQPDKGWPDLWKAIEVLEPGYRPQDVLLTDSEALETVPVSHSFLGRVEDPFAGVGLLVHPSRSESFGLMVAEAIAAGIPVVAARTGWLENYDWPWSFNPGSAEDLADSLRKIRREWNEVPAALHAGQSYLQSKYGRTSIDTVRRLLLEN